MKGRLVRAALWGCVVTASCAVGYLAGLGWGVLAWSVGTAAWLIFVVDLGDDEVVDTPSGRPAPQETTWIRRAG